MLGIVKRGGKREGGEGRKKKRGNTINFVRSKVWRDFFFFFRNHIFFATEELNSCDYSKCYSIIDSHSRVYLYEPIRASFTFSGQLVNPTRPDVTWQ